MLRFFAVFGNPISHSKSPLLHNICFQRLQNQLSFSGIYSKILLQNDTKLRNVFMDFNLSGANITLPFKEAAFHQCDEAVGIARDIKACNAWILESGKILGYNTDAEGFFECVKNANIKTALLLGAGGSARAVANILLKNNIKLSVINRSADKLSYFEAIGAEVGVSYEFKATKNYDLVINSTSAGLNDEALPLDSSILKEVFAESKLAFDLIYGKQTPFLKLAKSLNVPYADGRDMLINQAVLAFMYFCKSSNSNNDSKAESSDFKKQIQRLMQSII